MTNIILFRKNTLHFVFATVAICAALSTVTRADDVRQEYVRYDDLNIHTNAGAAVLLQRIQDAAARVCELPGTRDLDQLAAVKECTDHAIATAVDTIKRPALTRIYDEKFGITQSVTVVASR